MSGPVGSSQWMYSSGDFTIDQSLRFNDDDTHMLSWTPTSAGNRRTFTQSIWFKLGNIGSSVRLMTAQATAGGTPFYTVDVFQDTASDQRGIRVNSSANSDELMLITNGRLRDTGAWYHLVVAVDTTQGTSSNRCKIYLNGGQLTAFATETYPSQNYDTPCNNTIKHNVGAKGDAGGLFDGYMAEFHHIDGTALTPSSFGETGDYGEWKPKEYSGSYGTNGFYLPFKADYTVEGFNAITYKGDGADNRYMGGIGFKPGLTWIKQRGAGVQDSNIYDQIRGANQKLKTNTTDAEHSDYDALMSFNPDGFTLGNDAQVNDSGDTFVAWNWDMGTNSPTGFGCVTWKGDGNDGRPITGFGFEPNLFWVKAYDTNQGNHHIYDSVRGYPDRIMPQAVTAEGTGYVNASISDGVLLGDNQTVNSTSYNYVGYGWNMGGTSVTNTAGSINSTVMANPTYGQSIVNWTGTGADATVGHGLSGAPEMIITKKLSGDHWFTYHKDLTDASYHVYFNETTAQASSDDPWNDTDPTSTVFSLKSDGSVNANSQEYIAYCFDSVAGYSSFGGYTGDGTTNGSKTVTCGFRPAFVIIKCTNDTESWWLWDNQRNPFTDTQNRLAVDNENAQVTNVSTSADNIQFTSTGFKMTGLGGGSNQNNNTYIYMAFAGGLDSVAPVNTNGTIDSRVKANATYGQSIVQYQGASGVSNATRVGHGLSSSPEMIIIRDYNNTQYWPVWHKDMHSDGGFDRKLYLNDNGGVSGTDQRRVTSVSSTTFGLPEGASSGGYSESNHIGENHIAYCFHSVSGYSSFGTYTGNGSTTGPTVTTGFAPAFVMIKVTDRTDGGNGGWFIYDNTRSPHTAINHVLSANSDAAELVDNSNLALDFLSTGFQLKASYDEVNVNNGKYIYMAFADKREYAYWLDQSGNNNDFTNINLTESDIMVDSPTNNFATLNPLSHPINVGIALKEGNLTCGVAGESGHPRDVHSTIPVTTGKWYFVTHLGNAAHGKIGIWNLDVYQERINAPENPVTSAFSDGEGWGFIVSNGNKEHNASNASWDSQPSVGSIVMTAFDMDAGKVWWGVDGVWLQSGNPATGASAAYDEGALGFGTVVAVHSSNDGVVLTANFGQDSSFASNRIPKGNQDDNDIGDFYYEPPSGFLAMCTSNLPEPAVKPQEHFNAVSYTGNASTNAITGVGFQPDFLWLKKGNGGHHFVFDAVRGVGKQLKPSNTGGETSHSNYLASFDTDGFTIGSDTDTNADTVEHISWSWKANGSGSANTSGDINSTVSANTDAGFSIISYTGNGSSNQDVGHGLSKRPEMVIYRNRTSDSKNWSVYHKDLNAADEGAFHQNLNLTDARGAAAVIFNDQETTATTIPVGTSSDNNESGSSHIAYAFHSVDGFSRVGTYRGNGVTDGVFNYTGFRPAWVMLKCRNTTGGWNIIDNTREPYNPSDERVEAQAASAFDNHDSYMVDFLSNGFKMRGTNGEWNSASNTYTFLAFAETPLKYANAR